MVSVLENNRKEVLLGSEHSFLDVRLCEAVKFHTLILESLCDVNNMFPVIHVNSTHFWSMKLINEKLLMACLKGNIP